MGVAWPKMLVVPRPVIPVEDVWANRPPSPTGAVDVVAVVAGLLKAKAGAAAVLAGVARLEKRPPVCVVVPVSDKPLVVVVPPRPPDA